MAPRISFLADIRPGKIDFKIRVRVIRLWRVADRNNPKLIRSIELLLLDEKVCFVSSLIHFLYDHLIYYTENRSFIYLIVTIFFNSVFKDPGIS